MADGGTSIGQGTEDPRDDRVDADYRSINHARASLRRVITVRFSATWQHHMRRSRGARTTDRDQRHVRFKMDYNGPD